MMFIKYLLVLLIAHYAGKLVIKFGYPPMIGWVISAIIIGPNVVNLLTFSTMETTWHFYIDIIAKSFVGVMIGQGLVWATIKRDGKQLFTIELVKTVAVYGLIAIVFAIIFNRMGIPPVIALVLAAIATVVAPGSTIGVISECGARGPLSEISALAIPVNQVVNLTIFYISLSVTTSALVGEGGSFLFQMNVSLFAPIVFGAIMGLVIGFIIPKKMETNVKMPLFCLGVVITSVLCVWVGKTLFGVRTLDTILVNIVVTGIFVNIHSQKEVRTYATVYNTGLMILLVNVAARLDPTSFIPVLPLVFVYIIVRAISTNIGCRVGGKLSHAPISVQKFLGFTMLPHIGVSLSRAAIAYENLGSSFEEYGTMILLIISGASLINEFFALFISTKAYEWAGELPQDQCKMPE